MFARQFSLFFAILLYSVVLVATPSAKSQGPPDISVDCNFQQSIEFYNGNFQTILFYCYVENPSSVWEDVDFFYSSDELSIYGPSGALISPGSTEIVEVRITAFNFLAAGEYEASFTAVVKEAQGVPTWPLSPTDSDQMLVTVDEFTECSLFDQVGPGMGTNGEPFEVGVNGEISIELQIVCYSNAEVSRSFEFTMLDYGKIDTWDLETIYWPDGFEDISPPCDLEIEIGASEHPCEFRAVTSKKIISLEDFCLSMSEVGEEASEFCESNIFSVETKIFGFGSTGSVGLAIPVVAIIAVMAASFAAIKKKWS